MSRPRASAGIPDTGISSPPVRKRWIKALWVSCLVAIFVVPGVLVLLYFTVWSKTVLSPFLAAVPHDTTSVLYVDLRAFRNAAGLDADTKTLDASMREMVSDLQLAPDGAVLSSWLIAKTAGRETLEVWTFDRAVRFGSLPKGRFVAHEGFYADVFNPNRGWAIDTQGRLVSGPVHLIKEVLVREKANKRTASYDELSRWIGEVPSGALLWEVTDHARGGDTSGVLMNVPDWSELKNTRILGNMVALVYPPEQEPIVTGKTYFPSAADARAFHDALSSDIRSLAKQRLSLLAEEKLITRTVEKAHLEVSRTNVDWHAPLPIQLVRSAMDKAGVNWRADHRKTEDRVRQAVADKMRDGEAALAVEDFTKAAMSFGQALDFGPLGNEAKSRLEIARDAQERNERAARDAQERKERFQRLMREAEEALAKNDVAKAQEKKGLAALALPGEPLLLEFENKIHKRASELGFAKVLEEGNRSLEQMAWKEARAAFDQAEAILPKQPEVTRAFAGLLQIERGQVALKKISLALKDRDLQMVSSEMEEAGQFVRQLTALAAMDIRFKKPADLLLSDYHDKTEQWFDEIGAAVLKHDETILSIEARLDWDLTIKETEVAVKFIEQIQTRVPDPKKALTAQLSKRCQKIRFDLEEKAAAWTRTQKKATAEIHLDRGKKRFLEAKELLRTVRNDQSKAKPTQEAIRETVDLLEKASGELGKKAESWLAEAQQMRVRFNQLYEPFDLKFDSDKLPPGWSSDEKGWTTAPIGGLQPPPVPKATLSSPVFEGPPEYELHLSFAAVSQKGKLQNSAWQTQEGLLTVRLHPREPEASWLSITFGKDPKFALQDLASVSIAGRIYGIQSSIPDKKPMQLRVKGTQKGTEVIVNGRSLGFVNWRHPLKQVSFQAVNGQSGGEVTAAPVLFHASLRMPEKLKIGLDGKQK